MPNCKQPHTKKRSISNDFRTISTFTGIYSKEKKIPKNIKLQSVVLPLALIILVHSSEFIFVNVVG